MIDWSRYPNFTREGDFPDGEPQQDLLEMLQEARDLAGIPFVINSGVRPGDPRSHGRGYAADIKATTPRERGMILNAVYLVGFHRVGIYPRHIHVDCDPTLDADVCWIGNYDDD